MLTPGDEIIRYDGRTLALTTCPLLHVEARRGRRWGWFGKKGWWISLSLFQSWHVRKFVSSLSEAGIFFKQDPDIHGWINEHPRPSTPPEPSARSQGLPFLLF